MHTRPAKIYQKEEQRSSLPWWTVSGKSNALKTLPGDLGGFPAHIEPQGMGGYLRETVSRATRRSPWRRPCVSALSISLSLSLYLQASLYF